MRLYFAGVADPRAKRACLELSVRNYLLSFASGQRAFKQNADILENPECRVIVDSGAFSAWNSGTRIDIEKYADFALRLMAQARCDLIFVNLDVIPGHKGTRPTEYERDISAEQSFKNWQYLHKQGVRTMNVFHQYERFYWLDEFQRQSDYTGISPANDVSVDQRDRWLDQVFQRLGRSVKTHGFAVTATQLLLKYPFFSVDSTTWMGAVRYGSCGSTDWGRFGLGGTAGNGTHLSPFSGNNDSKFRIGVKKFLGLEKLLIDRWNRDGLRRDQQLPTSSGNKRKRKPRLDKEHRRRERMAKLASGSTQGRRADRFALRRTIAQLRRADWILYAVYEHLSDLALLPTGTSHPGAQLHYWELAEDFGVSTSTIRRKVRILEHHGLIKVERTASDCSPNLFTLLKPWSHKA